WQPGEQAVYLRNSDYVPREEAPSGSTGGKRVYLDKVIWRYLADPWDTANDLAAGEVDWWEQPPLDFIPKIEQNPDLQTILTDPLGTQGWLRPNCLHPPFNNRKAREALLHMMDQVTYLAWAIGPSQYYRACNSVFACRGPYATGIGAEPMIEHDLAKVRQLVKVGFLNVGFSNRPSGSSTFRLSTSSSAMSLTGKLLAARDDAPPRGAMPGPPGEGEKRQKIFYSGKPWRKRPAYASCAERRHHQRDASCLPSRRPQGDREGDAEPAGGISETACLAGAAGDEVGAFRRRQGDDDGAA